MSTEKQNKKMLNSSVGFLYNLYIPEGQKGREEGGGKLMTAAAPGAELKMFLTFI